jgi:hypothetical protein
MWRDEQQSREQERKNQRKRITKKTMALLLEPTTLAQAKEDNGMVFFPNSSTHATLPARRERSR